eukprot:5611073-Ditylum_brightwellii.AAC.1
MPQYVSHGLVWYVAKSALCCICNASISAAVMDTQGGTGTGPGFLGGLNAAPQEMVRYRTGFVTSARWP